MARRLVDQGDLAGYRSSGDEDEIIDSDFEDDSEPDSGEQEQEEDDEDHQPLANLVRNRQVQEEAANHDCDGDDAQADADAFVRDQDLDPTNIQIFRTARCEGETYTRSDTMGLSKAIPHHSNH